ncbi:unnamed protein product [Brachionus calyciflorus]|uniref:Large ribosomal subunit protein mL64 n=1 Tax=Brachionus calyciflorus TaxID=104777 RepID=A0A814BYH5_9BILA|nr:unnamed protein product [Brachionus calyciflorus]
MFLRTLRFRVFKIESFQKCNHATKTSETDFKTDEAKFDQIPAEFAPNIPDAEEAHEREVAFRQLIESKRDVSRFSNKTAYNKYKNIMPTYSDSQAKYLKTERYFRKVYSKFGKASAIESGIAWPSKSQLEKLIKEEKEYDLTLEQKVNILIEKKANELKTYEKLVKDTDEALKKMPINIESFYQRIIKKDKSEKDKTAKRQEILDQAREYYGYDVDLRDPRVQEMLKKIQDERKMAEKAKKKEEDKKKQQAVQLQQKLKQTDKIVSKTEEPEKEQN